MTFLVFDLPASESGALAVLKDFYSYVNNSIPLKDRWIFIVSTDSLEEPASGSGVEIMKLPEVKKSWLHRILYECFFARRLIKRFKPDAILSLQNTAIIGTRVPQVIYVHQSLPYASWRFSYLRREERFLALYTNIMRPIIGWSIRVARTVIVQTHWFKTELSERHCIDQSKIHVIRPSVYFKVPEVRKARDYNAFFYPTTAHIYKNIDLILDASVILKRAGLCFQVELTLNGEENSYAQHIVHRITADGLESYISLIGRISRELIAAKYESSTLLFPSKIESFGLPLLEARLCGGRVIAADTPFAIEILDGYPAASFHGIADATGLACEMAKCIDSEQDDKQIPTSEKFIEGDKGWHEVIKLVRKSVN